MRQAITPSWCPICCPVQLGLICRLMRNYGYKMELLHTEGPNIAEQGLRNVHNDTCYPALLVIGQLMDAIESGRYDVHKIALILPQTGGGCRASNYIHLLRKALEKNGYGFIPVISLNFSGLESNPGFKLTKTMLVQVAYALLIGDLIMMVANQCRPYEIVAGSTDKAIDICMDAGHQALYRRARHTLRRGQAPVPVRARCFRQGSSRQDAEKETRRHRRRDLRQVLSPRQQPAGGVPALRGL
ncbi:MAG: hypothetical protein ACLR4Z_05125 [Butyricicoccaceae bacterium]